MKCNLELKLRLAWLVISLLKQHIHCIWKWGWQFLYLLCINKKFQLQNSCHRTTSVDKLSSPTKYSGLIFPQQSDFKDSVWLSTTVNTYVWRRQNNIKVTVHYICIICIYTSFKVELIMAQNYLCKGLSVSDQLDGCRRTSAY